MVDISRIKKGQILITEESMGGQIRFIYGPVFLINYDKGEVAIKSGEDMRSFPVDRLWTIPAFIAHKTTECLMKQ